MLLLIGNYLNRGSYLASYFSSYIESYYLEDDLDLGKYNKKLLNKKLVEVSNYLVAIVF